MHSGHHHKLLSISSSSPPTVTSHNTVDSYKMSNTVSTCSQSSHDNDFITYYHFVTIVTCNIPNYHKLTRGR